MNKEELIKQGLTDEQASKVMSMYKEAIKGQVPQSRLDEVVKERNELREKTAQQLEALSKSNGDVDGLKAQIAKMRRTTTRLSKPPMRSIRHYSLTQQSARWQQTVEHTM